MVELILALDQSFAEFRNTLERGAAGKFAGGIDGLLRFISLAPAADGIEVFQSEAERIDLAMALGAGGNLTVLDE